MQLYHKDFKSPGFFSHFLDFEFNFSCFILLIFIFSPPLYSLDFPLDLHCSAYFSHFLNSDTSRYYMESSVNLHSTMVRIKELYFFINYQDDLEVKGGDGVLFDPRFVHYYIASGFDYFLKPVYLRFNYIHDCIHDIDSFSTRKPIFNRFRFQIGDCQFHYSKVNSSSKKFLWSFFITYYAHWQYHGWDINAGADYQYDFALQSKVKLFKKDWLGFDFNPEFLITKGTGSYYHQHLLRLLAYYQNNSSAKLGIGVNYNLYNNDPIRNPHRLWQLLIFFQS